MKRLKGLIPCCILELKNSETTGIFYPHWDRFFEVVLQNKNKMRARACSSVLQWFRQRHLPNRTRRFPIPNAMLPFGWLCVQTQSFLWRTGQLGSPVLHKTADLFDCTFLVDQLVTCILQGIAGEQPGWKSDSITPLSSPREVYSTSSYTSAQLTANTELLTPISCASASCNSKHSEDLRHLQGMQFGLKSTFIWHNLTSNFGKCNC